MMDKEFALAHQWSGVPFHHALTKHGNVVARMLEWATTRPGDPYLVAVGLDGANETLSFGELEARSRHLAAWVLRELGVRSGDVVALLPRNDLRSVVAIFALWRVGASIFFINPAEPPKRMTELLGALPIKALLAPSPQVAAQHPSAVPIPDAPQRTDAELVSSSAPLGAEACAYFGTSGSTSISKIVSQAHYNAAMNAEAVCRHHGLERGVRLIGCLPIHHVNGLHFTVLAPLWGGACSILLEAFRTEHYQSCLERYRPHVASVVPSMLETLLSTWRGIALPSELRHFVSAAAPLPTRVCAAALETMGARVLQGYGLTETTNFSTTIPRGLSDADYRRLMIDVDIPSIGIAVHGNEVAVLRPDGSPAQPGQVGEICMRGHNVMLGYTGNDEATREAFRHGWFHSQDLGYQVDDPSGRAFFVITGRTKSMAKVLGLAVSLEEMERALRVLPDVNDAACFSVPDQVMGESIIAVVVSSSALDTSRVSEHLKGYFSPAVLPLRYVQAEAIPRTMTGKIIRGQLPSLLASAARQPERM